MGTDIFTTGKETEKRTRMGIAKGAGIDKEIGAKTMIGTQT